MPPIIPPVTAEYLQHTASVYYPAAVTAQGEDMFHICCRSPLLLLENEVDKPHLQYQQC